jgi:broad specificity phosphatase PhoE
MPKVIELRRHTDSEGDVLTPDGVQAAVEIGSRLDGDYDLLVSTGAQRCTQTLGCFLAGLGQTVSGGVVVEPGLRSDDEDRWRELYQEAGSGELEAFRKVDASFVEAEARRLAQALQRVLEALPDGGRALAVGHSPTNEAAVWGLSGEAVDPVDKGAGVLIVADDGAFRVEAIE